jgi:hypothetical protein
MFPPGPLEFAIVGVIAAYLSAKRLPEVREQLLRIPRNPIERERYFAKLRFLRQISAEGDGSSRVELLLVAVLLGCLLVVCLQSL